MAKRSEARTGFGRSNTAIVGSNPTRGMDVYPRFCWIVLSCVSIETLPRADYLSKESH
jgi:hypothetical protein